jgi:hypothetical protein
MYRNRFSSYSRWQWGSTPSFVSGSFETLSSWSGKLSYSLRCIYLTIRVASMLPLSPSLILGANYLSAPIIMLSVVTS